MSQIFPLTRRQALIASGAALLTGAAGAQLTVADNGGPVGASFREAFYDPFEQATGIRIVNVTQNVDPVAAFKVMVETKAYTVDVALLTPGFVYRLTHNGDYLDTLGLTAAELPGMIPALVTPTFMGTDVWTTVFAYRTDTFSAAGPQSWADFWNVEKFPGRRGLYRSPSANLEIALMADGVPYDKVYPLDVDRAFRSLDRIKPHIDVWWASGAQSTQLLQSGEVDLLSIWSARAQVDIDGGTPARIVWNQNIASVDGWSIPKGTPRLDLARQFVRFCAGARQQAAYTTVMRNGPTNLDAYDVIPPERGRLLPTFPDNRRSMVLLDNEWWGANYAAIKQRFDAWLLA